MLVLEVFDFTTLGANKDFGGGFMFNRVCGIAILPNSRGR